jgi:multiple sugar transport system substrate-binding protein
MIPGSRRVWNAASGNWDEGDEVRRAPYLGWGGWHASVAATSPNQAAAWHFADYIDSDRAAQAAVTTPGTARGPYRTDHFTPAAWTRSAVKFAQPEDYLKAQQDSFAHPNVQFDLRIPEAGRYFEALDTATQLALAGQRSPQDALSQCAKDWAGITDQIGKESQQDLYKKLQVDS